MYEPQVAMYEPQVAMYEPQVAMYEPQVAMYEPQVAMYEPQVAMYEPQVAMYKPQVAMYEPQAPHACLGSHGDQHKSHGSQMNPTRDPTSEESHVQEIPQAYRIIGEETLRYRTGRRTIVASGLEFKK